MGTLPKNKKASKKSASTTCTITGLAAIKLKEALKEQAKQHASKSHVKLSATKWTFEMFKKYFPHMEPLMPNKESVPDIIWEDIKENDKRLLAQFGLTAEEGNFHQGLSKCRRKKLVNL